MRDVSVARVMSENPVTITPDTSVEEAQTLLELGELHHLPVVEDDRLVGIVSSADLLKLHLLEERAETLDRIHVASIMVDSPVTLSHRASLRDAVAKLSLGGFHALPVTGDDGELAGIVTSADLGLYLLQRLPTGDGSLDAEPETAGRGGLMSDARFVEGLRALKTADDSDAVASFARLLLDERRTLEAVRKAAEGYFRSGHAEQELAKLRKVLAEARQLPEPTIL